jgi:hypothetical protein
LVVFNILVPTVRGFMIPLLADLAHHCFGVGVVVVVGGCLLIGGLESATVALRVSTPLTTVVTTAIATATIITATTAS